MQPKGKSVKTKSRRKKEKPPSDTSEPKETPENTRHETEETFQTTYLSQSTPPTSVGTPLTTSTALTAITTASDQVTAGFSDYIIAPGGPLLAPWDNTIYPSNLGTFYEPQGELTDQLGNQNLSRQQDFVIPVVVSGYSRSPQYQNTITNTSPDIFDSINWADYLSESDISVQEEGESSLMDMSASTRAGMKRKAMPESVLAAPSTETGPSNAKRLSTRGDEHIQPGARRRMSKQSTGGQTEPSPTPVEETPSGESNEQAEQAAKTPSQVQTGPSVSKPEEHLERLNPVLPPGKVFPIRIGATLFHLSGGSISSDAPSYFSQYFAEQLLHSGGRTGEVKTLYIDRDPTTFQDIVLHLQGYHIKPRDGTHYVKLFADAQYYSLPRLTRHLYKSDIFIQIGERNFQIPRSLISSPGDLPNFFSLGFARAYAPPETIPSIEGQALRRPPAIRAPIVTNRSGEVFADLLRILQGYNISIKDEAHRAELLRDARYFHLKGVEQKLIPCEISYNIARNWSEIVIRLEDLRQSGITFLPDAESEQSVSAVSKPATPHDIPGATFNGSPGWIRYQRPYIDDSGRHLVLEASGREETLLNVGKGRAKFEGETRVHISNLFQVIATKMGLPTTLPLGAMLVQSGGGVASQPPSPANSGISEDQVKVRIGRDAHVELDGKELVWEEEDEDIEEEEERFIPALVKQGQQTSELTPVWAVQRALWRLRVENSKDTGKPEVVLCAVKIVAYSKERSRNQKRKFL